MAKVEHERDVEAAIVVAAMPQDWAAANSFGQAKLRQRLSERLQRAGRLARLLSHRA